MNQPNSRRSGRAIRKSLPPTRRAPPPPPASPPNTRSPRQQRKAWTDSPPADALDRLVTEGLAYRYRKPKVDKPVPNLGTRVRYSEPSGEWSERNPRSAAMLAHKIHATPISFARHHPPFNIPHPHGSMREMEDFANKVMRTTLARQSVAVALGFDPKNAAIKRMSHEEREMYQCWKKGVRLPEENWKDMDTQLEEGDDHALWSRRAQHLNRIYELRSVTAGRAKSWWKANGGWRPLLVAFEKVHAAQVGAEERVLQEILNNVLTHLKWVNACTARYDESKERASQAVEAAFAEILASGVLRETSPSGPLSKTGSRQHPAKTLPEPQSTQGTLTDQQEAQQR